VDSEFVKGEDGCDQWTPEKYVEVLRRYLRPCGQMSVSLGTTPLSKALNRRGLTLVEADNAFVFMSHLKSALALRQNLVPWDLVTIREFMDRVVGHDTPQEARATIRSGFDPLVLMALRWPTSVKISMQVGSILRERDTLEHPTLLVVRRTADIPTSPDEFDPELREWLRHDVPRVTLTVASVRTATVQAEKLASILAARPAFARLDRPPKIKACSEDTEGAEDGDGESPASTVDFSGLPWDPTTTSKGKGKNAPSHRAKGKH